MLRIRTSMLVLLLSLGMQGLGAGGCGTKRDTAQQNANAGNVNTTVRPAPLPAEEPAKREMNVIATGSYGSIFDTSVVVARDVETYAALREVAQNSIPDLNADYFKTNIVVAAFLGRRNTGGYDIQITRAGDYQLRVSSTSPPKDAFTTQALTAPFKIVSIPIDENRAFAIEFEPLWNNQMRPYRLTGGEFTTGGGFAGRFENLQLTGDIHISRLGPLATFVFDLKSTGGTKARLLRTAVTGIVGSDGSITNATLDAGSLVDFPRSPLSLKGSFTNNEDKLSLSFESLPSNVADGYGGQGKLEAAATAPPPAKKKPASDDGAL